MRDRKSSSGAIHLEFEEVPKVKTKVKHQISCFEEQTIQIRCVSSTEISKSA